MTTSLRGLLEWIYEHPAYTTLQDNLQAELTLPPQALIARARPPVIAALVQRLHVPTVIVTPTVDDSRHLYETLHLWLDETHNQQLTLIRFPEPPVLFYERAPWTPEAITDRMHVLTSLTIHRTSTATHTPFPVIITSARALMQRTLPYRQFRRVARKIEVGARESLTGLARHVSSLGYESVSVVQAPGQFSRRGGLLDIFPAHANTPYRLEFFGDEVDTIRIFTPETQRSTERVEQIWLGPIREALPRDSERALDALHTLLNNNLPPEVRLPLEADAEALEAGIPFPTLEFYLPYLYQETGSLLHYLPMNARVILNNADQLKHHWEELEQEALELQQRAWVDGYLPEDAPPPYIAWEEINRWLESAHTLNFVSGEEGPLAEALTPEVHFAGRLPEALGRIRQWVSLGDQVVLISRQAARVAELWQDFTPPPVYESLPVPPKELIVFVQGTLPGGWQWNGPRGTRHLLTDEELFGWRPPEPRRRRRRITTPEFNFADLQEGDPVVHEDYGIGIFRGLVIRNMDEIEREYLLLEYAQNDKLYVPIHQADRLTRHIGTEGFSPQLNRLGGTEWIERKTRVQKAVDEIAGELLDLYAARQIVKGHAFAPDTSWQGELEAAFPYVETEDQIQAITAVKADMEKPRPMDRLICGDAGYGKTEVALRAAFKAVTDGKQVVMLVPTTVLAQQHYQTFQERLASFPVTVELLSRFRTDAEQHQVLSRMQEGRVDIVIGTHRLLQKDVSFKDLGLVIIDEEQRFGVAHKERLKQMRTEVDVLTLTATPIPRTLYMALTGVRDISIIETPPQERLPISTYVGPHDPDITRRAILREVERGGQIFYVHNRVESIRGAANHLRQLVPDVEIAIAHGQMRERELARVMQRFTEGEIKVLLATTIIESGLDFPNANTLIVERADRFGLAQLYQLRGRVGRGTRRGYAYFFHGRRMKEEAQARLQALQETTSTGGGFSVSMRDLELRGAGELLGKHQHGHVAAVGFTLYTRMLTRAVERLKAEREGAPQPAEPIGSISIELPLAVGLPTDYIPNDKLRLQLYRRMAELTTDIEITHLEEELQDRFGPLPTTTQQLLYQLRLKVLARDARIPAITVESGQIVLRPPWLKAIPRHLEPAGSAEVAGHPEMTGEAISRLRRQIGTRARIGRQEIWLTLSWEQEQWQSNLQTVLATIADWWRTRN
ncbi:MAG: transcription-repair coupling factor [Anaerolineae bacterium]|nr:transcription-repair coupling factor [Anaerolineae bacterium]